MDNRYEKYIANPQDNSQLSEHLKFGGALIAGAVGGRYGYNHRSQIGTAYSRLASGSRRLTGTATARLAQSERLRKAGEETGDFLTSLHEGLGGENPLRFLSDSQRFERRFEENMLRRQSARLGSSESPLRGQPTRLEQDYQHYQKSAREGRESVYKDAYVRHVNKAMEQQTPRQAEQGLEEILTQQEPDFWRNFTPEKIKGLTRKRGRVKGEAPTHDTSWDEVLDFDSSQQRADFEEKLFENLKTYQDRKFYSKSYLAKGGKSKDGVEISGYKKLEKNLREGLKRDHQKRDTFFTRMMEDTGYRQVTVKDALDHGLFEDGAIRIPSREGKGAMQDAKIGRKLGQTGKADSEFMDLSVDPSLFIGEKGDLLDLRQAKEGLFSSLDTFKETVQMPWLRFNPLDLAQWSTIRQQMKKPSSTFFKRGTIDPILGASVRTHSHPMRHNQDAAVGPLTEDYYYTGGNVYDVTTGSLVKENQTIVSANFGFFQRSTSGMANLHRHDYKKQGFLGKLFDVGAQEQQGLAARSKTILTKFDNETWMPNTVSRMGAGKMDPEQGYRIMNYQVNTKAKPLSDEAASFLNRHVQSDYAEIGVDLTKLRTEDEIMDAFSRIYKSMGDGTSNIKPSGRVSDNFESMWGAFERDPQGFRRSSRMIADDHPMIPEGIFSGFDVTEAEHVGIMEDVKRLIHQHAIDQVESRGTTTVGRLVKEGVQEGQVRPQAMKEVRDLQALSELGKYRKSVYQGTPDQRSLALNEFSEVMKRNDRGLTSVLEEFSADYYKPWQLGPGDGSQQHFGRDVQWQTINKARGHRWFMEDMNKRITEGQNQIQAAAGSAMSVLKQPFSGRHDLGDVTQATVPAYYIAERLDNAIGQIGLGLSHKNRGSLQSIMGNQFGRRIVLPYMAYEQARFADGITGGIVSDKLAEMYATMHEDVANFKEATGLNRVGRSIADVIDGTDQMAGTPVNTMLRVGSFGLIGDNRSGEEVRDYYETGVNEIRSGRWWAIGSKTPWIGSKIERHEPNWYRKMKSDYEFSENMYGSRAEYYRNHFVPTPMNPIAPLTYLAYGNRHYQKKHEETRPYPIKGGMAELEQIPLVGSMLNRTVGGLFNPFREHPDLEKHHRNYIEEVNQQYKDQYELGAAGGTAKFMGGGQYRLYGGAGSGPAMGGQGSGGTGQGGQPGAEYLGMGVPLDHLDEESRLMQSLPEGELAMGTGASGGGVPGVGKGGGVNTTGDVVRMQMGQTNQSMSEGASPVPSIRSLDSLRDPNMQAELSDIHRKRDLKGTMTDSFYSLSEISGIYGFLGKWGLGFDESWRGSTLESSNQMMSYSRRWWDLEMGGLSGMPSEIGRRYLPRDMNKHYYNPIKNQMPEWLPGSDYFVDFTRGDPYTKISKGEMRLPGEAYEKLHRLHPDALGEYGAFDRFRILADVAPHSDEYSFYRRMVTQMNQEDMLTPSMKDMYDNTLDQVTEAGKKYNFYPRRFRDADVDSHDVTITRVIDQNTFMTKEFGRTPIKLAGVSMSQDSEEAMALASQFIYEGANVQIEVDSDPLHRERDDSLGTMRAVVRTQQNEEGLPWYYSNRGQNLNYMLANRKFEDEDEVTVNNDGSAVDTRALHDKNAITVGKIWERISHELLPNIPIAGIVADKFLQIRSPLEMYKREEVYGKAWRPWQEPISSWLRPISDQITEQAPVVGALQGAGMGWLGTKGAGAIRGRGKPGGRLLAGGKYYGTMIGGLVGGLMSSARVFKESAMRLNPATEEETWIPERRQDEREINEYFDRIRYLKYKGLFEKASDLAYEHEGIDMEELLAQEEATGRKNDNMRRTLERSRKYLSLQKELGYVHEEQLDNRMDYLREELGEIGDDRRTYDLGPYSMLAMRYHAEYTSTLYGADPYGDMSKIYRALPSKDREFFTEFMNASPKDREEILRLVPKDQRRFYKAKWGLDHDDPESMSSFFNRYHLPDDDWDGWDPSQSLDSIKLKVVKQEGLELTEFGLWPDDQKRAAQQEAEPIQSWDSPSSRIDTGRLSRVLEGAGLTDVNVKMQVAGAADEGKIDVGFNIVKDRMNDIKKGFNDNMQVLF